MKVYVTFGQKYRREAHPRVEWAHPDGWLEVLATNREQGVAAAVALLGGYWACNYTDSDWDPAFYSRGCLARLDASTGHVAVVPVDGVERAG